VDNGPNMAQEMMVHWENVEEYGQIHYLPTKYDWSWTWYVSK